MIKAHNINYLVWEALPVIEAGLGEKVTVKEIEQHVEKGDIVPFLQERFPFGTTGGMDLSLFLKDNTIGKQKMLEVTKHLQDAVPAFEGRERRKMGVTKNGLCFLIGLCAEVIQRGNWQEPHVE